MVTFKQLLSDLVLEQDEFFAMVGSLRPSDLDIPTPAQGWMIRDQISHIAFFDEVAAIALINQSHFEEVKAELMTKQDPMEVHLDKGRSMNAVQLLDWGIKARNFLDDSLLSCDQSSRVPWFGSSMSAMSFATARLMETWAHGQDIADAMAETRLQVERLPTARLKHIAELGVRTRPFSYMANGAEPPTADIRVEIKGPQNELWEWGKADAEDAIIGSAVGFCLVVTARRHIDDTDVIARGPLAIEWMNIAQTFAGPPGARRLPGQFPWLFYSLYPAVTSPPRSSADSEPASPTDSESTG
ncbi:MAG: TIGR03084 family metal-binding protein [Actinobacteria bacterium]|nr:TIGR03084 family metal-binding protein [Actinomycetota bacterium]MCL6105432.1 TIGR03084 family metal-binding protein [Actinomycetota bacterium]